MNLCLRDGNNRQTYEAQLCLSGIESHSFMSIGKRYCEVSRRLYPKIRVIYSTVKPHHLLKFDDEVMNVTVRENGLLSSRIVLEIFSRFPILSTDPTAQKKRMDTIKDAQDKTIKFIVLLRILQS